MPPKGCHQRSVFVESNRAFDLVSEAEQSEDRKVWSSLMKEALKEPQSTGKALFALNMVILLLAALHVYYSIRNKWLLPTLGRMQKKVSRGSPRHIYLI